ncbi:hypothetical protein Fcan01_28348 [Folsomia candida]|uniref:Uncharacterized protein n=1 Tax=Folsomia candida TaxID=158441 RepID=A0A226CTT8_FOLCA|nr:hypothetical protein Fcan01_28348 [Folsomia candida]
MLGMTAPNEQGVCVSDKNECSLIMANGNNYNSICFLNNLDTLVIQNRCFLFYKTGFRFKEYENFKALSTEILNDAKMDLRQWEHTTVGTSGVGYYPYRGLDGDSDCAPQDSSIKTTTMVLGLVWDKEEDSLSCKVKIADLPDKLTKREILSRIQKIFDPIGFTCPATLQPKILLQEAWTHKMEWDTELSQEMQLKFRSWCEEIECLTKIKIPRWASLSSCLPEDLQFHVFCDASQVAYACVVYARVRIGDEVEVHLLQAKSRVAPLKKMTIPRLEL